MNDIITDFIGKQIAKRVENNLPINNEKQVFTTKQINHFVKCQKQDCQECKGLIQK